MNTLLYLIVITRPKSEKGNKLRSIPKDSHLASQQQNEDPTDHVESMRPE